MIRARKLFLFPAVTGIILLPLFPLGLGLWIFLVSIWYAHHHEEVDAWVKGYVYKKKEYSNSEELI